MTVPQHELKALAIELAAALPEPPPRRVEIVAGELLSSEAMGIARSYELATPLQQRALGAVVASWEKTP
ncbi:MAG: hypothetical protein LCH70_07630 [Proteobacteria bacterium]|nr:hypothetical protein [Pseudomonadota bacterium]